jgi:hypothetical protein
MPHSNRRRAAPREIHIGPQNFTQTQEALVGHYRFLLVEMIDALQDGMNDLSPAHIEKSNEKLDRINAEKASVEREIKLEFGIRDKIVKVEIAPGMELQVIGPDV